MPPGEGLQVRGRHREKRLRCPIGYISGLRIQAAIAFSLHRARFIGKRKEQHAIASEVSNIDQNN